ncbi:Uncharacterized protein dnm_024360 [Desulfonema magnum]|uniref:Uncharacterized protein n=1 Tax=Desulfonema magnum TaxID=45655 RepID=A0A975GM37_9BACT|nr:Uncharacterized protein dnm_024360 [Desulfonema magnum]
MSGEETRLFFRNDPPSAEEKAGFLCHSEKKCMKNFCSGTYMKSLVAKRLQRQPQDCPCKGLF